MSINLILLIILVPVVLFGMAGVFGLILLKMLQGNSRDHSAVEDETRMIQEIYNSLSGMEKRIESLETIIIEKEGEHDE
ncbi:MAG: phage-shock protein [Planctomycetota bacterium]|nr:phage-shock protein [Planctomycetota bacterium]MDA1137971.1 phage-shock protein [Planctomycetota bacterium]